jgi:polyisoprenoid-binding protein YceI
MITAYFIDPLDLLTPPAEQNRYRHGLLMPTVTGLSNHQPARPSLLKGNEMKSLRPALALSVLLLAGLSMGLAPQDTPASPAATYKVDVVHSTALFRVHHLGAGQFWGRFNEITGTFTHGEGAKPTFEVEIATESVDTNNDSLDGHLKSPDFFNAKEFPTMRFKSTSAKKKGEGTYDVTGDLTIRGITKRITAEIEHTGERDAGARFGYRCGFEARFTVKRSDFEVSYGVDNGLLGDETRVIVALEGVRE